MKQRSLILILALAGFFSACQEKVDLDLENGETKLVIEGYLATEADSSFVKLSRSIGYFESGKPPAVTDATVEISGGGNTILFNHTQDGIYKPGPGYVPDTGITYNLRVLDQGVEYTSQSTLFPMFYVDTNLIFEFRQASGFVEEGYAVTYWSNDTRPQEIFTQFKFGQNDTVFDQTILFTNADLIKGQLRPFELPFYRAQSGDSVMLIFKSIDVSVATYLNALANLTSGAPGPFQTPPANPPTNIEGGAIGYFKATDVVRVNQVAP